MEVLILFFFSYYGVFKRVRKSPRYQTKIQHPTHSAWSERKGQWPRVQCATLPWEPRLRDRGAPVHCKFEKKEASALAYIAHIYCPTYGYNSIKTAYQPMRMRTFEPA